MKGRLELASVSVRFGDRSALRELDLTTEPGETLALLGASGSGKTTTLRLLNGLQAPTSGAVRLDDRELTERSSADLRQVRSRIGFVPQQLALMPNVSVLANVLAGALGRRGQLAALRSWLLPTRDDEEQVHALLERLGIGDLLYQRVDRLSGGQQQRVAVARALFQEPRVLLADEPVSSVDPARARDLLELLLELADERGFALVASLHDHGLARELFPRLVGLSEGRLVFDAPAADVSDETLATLHDLAGARA
ncbi:MAG: ATP-binding cassette domain-containing protein [Acidobacteriota bacterium]